jgi:starch synthase
VKFLLLCEGDAETRDSWSGSTKSLLDELRALGHQVRTADVDLYGAQRLLAAVLSFSPRSAHWRVKYRLSATPFLLRSKRAAAAMNNWSASVDCIIQIGATFRSKPTKNIPYFLYCDSNIRMSERGGASGHTQASALSQSELRLVVDREASVYQGAAGIFTISERLRRSFVEDFGIDPVRVHTVHAGPNFDPGILGDYLRTRESKTDKPPTILFVGRKFQRKGGDLLLRAFRTVRQKVANARLVVIGPSTLDVHEPGVECLGFLDKDSPADRAVLMQAYNSADVFCLPTRFEPFGIVFLEAMYFGLPCVGTNAWAVPEMITDGVTGYTVPVDDAEALAARLVELLRDPALGRRMGEAGRARAESHFTWRAVAERMMRVVDPRLPNLAPQSQVRREVVRSSH